MVNVENTLEIVSNLQHELNLLEGSVVNKLMELRDICNEALEDTSMPNLGCKAGMCVDSLRFSLHQIMMKKQQVKILRGLCV